MMLKPVSPITTILEKSGVIPPAGASRVSDILNAQGLTLENCAQNLRELTDGGEPTIRLKATEMGFKLHGALKEAETQSVPQITFVFQGEAKLAAILTPRE